MSDTPQSHRLRALLSCHGASDTPLFVEIAWAAFKDYGREVFGTEGIGLLFQVGVFDFTGEPLYYFDPICQFEQLDGEGEHSHYEQLHLTLTCAPNKSLSGIEAILWSFGYPTADAYFAAVEAMPEFQVAVKQAGYVLEISHEEV